MPRYRASEVALLLGVSDDTVRRWIDAGRLSAERDDAGRYVVDGAELAEFTREHAHPPQVGGLGASSARNRLTGLVTRVLRDEVMAQVDLQAGPFRLVSLLSREAVDEMGLEPGVLVVASVKSTNVGIEMGEGL
jgi:molybdopterin-binding protein